MRLAMPDYVRRLPLDRPELAVREYAEIVAALRDAPTIDLEGLATEAVESALEAGAVLLAVVTAPDAAPAVLTGIPLDATCGPGTAAALRDSMEDVGGPDVRETVVLETGCGPVVVAQRVPGVEQVRARQRPLTLQLQAFLPDPDTGATLLLTLACPSDRGWLSHQLLFGQIVTSAAPDPEEAMEAFEMESFESRTYRL
jgi:hypothetical protein